MKRSDETTPISPIRNQKKDPNDLMIAFIAGDDSAFEKLYHHFKRAIYFYILGMCGQTQLSEELAHETFLKVYKNRDKFDHSQKFTTWLWAIARNATIDELRKSKGDQILFDETQIINEDELDMPTHYQECFNREQLLLAINELKPRQKEALMLRTYSELSYEELANIMKIEVQALKALLLRARKKVESILIQKKVIEEVS